MFALLISVPLAADQDLIVKNLREEIARLQGLLLNFPQFHSQFKSMNEDLKSMDSKLSKIQHAKSINEQVLTELRSALKSFAKQISEIRSEIRAENEKQRAQILAMETTPPFSLLIPGLPGIQRGDYYTGYGLLIGNIALALATVDRQQRYLFHDRKLDYQYTGLVEYDRAMDNYRQATMEANRFQRLLALAYFASILYQFSSDSSNMQISSGVKKTSLAFWFNFKF